MKTAGERSAAALLALLFAVCVWRAATQSIVHDEALTWQIYLATPVATLFEYFDPNHHFLHTVLMRLATGLFGYSELAMRLPALFGAALFCVSTWRFCRWAVGSGWRLPLAVAAASLNPLVLDFLTAARGYGLALALWMTALSLAAPEMSAAVYDRRRMALASLAAALSVAANLVFAAPVLALFGMLLWIGNRRAAALARSLPASDKKARKKRREAAVAYPPLWLDLFLPSGAIGLLFLIASPLKRATGEQFYVGTSRILECLGGLAAESFGAGALSTAAMAAGPLIVAAGAALGVWKTDLPLLFASLPAAGAAVLLVILHVASGMPYPVDRTGLYFLVAAALSLAFFTAESWPRPLRVAALGLTAAVVVAFAVQFRWQWFSVWRYDADTALLARRLALETGGQPVRLAYSWQLEPALDFYRDARGYQHLPAAERTRLAPGYDYYLLIPQDQGAIASFGLKVVARGAVSGTVLAAR